MHDLRNMIVEVFYFFHGETGSGQFSVIAITAHQISVSWNVSRLISAVDGVPSYDL